MNAKRLKANSQLAGAKFARNDPSAFLWAMFANECRGICMSGSCIFFVRIESISETTLNGHR